MNKTIKEEGCLVQRSDEIVRKYDLNSTIQKMLSEYFNLGRANVYGAMLYMLESKDLDKESIRKYILTELKQDTQMRRDTYGVWSELKMRFDKE